MPPLSYKTGLQKIDYFLHKHSRQVKTLKIYYCYEATVEI